MPSQRVASATGRTTRHSKRLASGNGEDVSPLRSLPEASKPRKASARIANPRTRQVEPSPSIDEADDSTSQQRDSRSQSVDEPESRSSSPPRESQPVRRSTRTSRSASRSVSPVSARTKRAPAKTASTRSRRRAAPSATPELEAIIESPQKKLPGAFPAIDADTQIPTTEHDVEHTHVSTTFTSPVKKRRRQESPPDHPTTTTLDRDNAKSQKRARRGNYAPTLEKSTSTSEHAVEPAPSSLTLVPYTSPSSNLNTIANGTPIATPKENVTEAVTTPVASTGGFFSRIKNLLPRSAGPVVRTQDAEQNTPIQHAPEIPPHIVAILESPISGPTLKSTTPVVFPGPNRPIHSEPRANAGGAWEAYAKHRPPPVFRKYPGSARKVTDEDEDMFEISDREDNDFVGIASHRNSRALLRKHASLLESKKLERRRADSKNRAEKSPKSGETPSKSDSSMLISNISLLNALIIPATSSADKIVLTDPKIIDMVRSVVTWAASKPQNELPDGQQMTSLLEKSVSKKSVNESAMASPINTPSRNNGILANSPAPATTDISIPSPSDSNEEVPLLDCVYDKLHPATGHVRGNEQYTMSGGLGEAMETDGEVRSEPSSSPFVSSPLSEQRLSEKESVVAEAPPIATPSKSWFFNAASVAKTVVTSPLKVFGFGNQASPLTPRTAQLTDDINFEHQESPIRDPKSPTPFNKRRTPRTMNKGHALKVTPSKHSDRTPRQIRSVPRSAMKSNLARPVSDDEDDRHREQRNAKRVTWGQDREEESYEPSPKKNDHGKRELSPGRTFQVPEPESDSDEDDVSSEADTADNLIDELPADDKAALKMIQDLEEVDPERAYRLCRQLSDRIRARKASSGENGIAKIVAQKVTAYEKYHSGSFHVQAGQGPLNPDLFLSPISERSERSRSSLSPAKRTPNNVFKASANASPRTPVGSSPQTSPFQWSVASGRPGPSSFGVPDIDYGSDSEDEEAEQSEVASEISMSDAEIPSTSLQSENRDSNETLPAADRGNEVAVKATPLKERTWPQTPSARPPKTPLPESVTKYKPSVSSGLRFVSNMSPLTPDENMNLFDNIAFQAADGAPTPPLIELDLNCTIPFPPAFLDPEIEAAL